MTRTTSFEGLGKACFFLCTLGIRSGPGPECVGGSKWRRILAAPPILCIVSPAGLRQLDGCLYYLIQPFLPFS